MALRKLEKAEWRGYFDFVSKGLVGKRAQIEVASLALGDQIEADWLPFLGIVYDSKDHLVEIALDGVDHMIRAPGDVWIDEDTAGLTGLAVIDQDGTRHIVKLRDPLMLPKPSAAAQAARR